MVVELDGYSYTFEPAPPGDRGVESLVATVGQERLTAGCSFIVARHEGDVVGYVASRPGPEPWDLEVMAVATRDDHRGRGLYRALNMHAADELPDTGTICAYVDDPVTEHVVQTYWRPHESRVCENGSRFYGTRKSQVIAP